MSENVTSSTRTKPYSTELIGQMLVEIVRSLASRPDCVAIRTINECGIRVMIVTVAKVDLQKVTGKDGRAVRSLRVVVGAIAQRSGQRLEVDVRVDEADEA